VTKEGLAERDRIVLEGCRERGVPVAVTMAGGYSEDIGDIVDVHFASISRAAGMTQPHRERGLAHG
jgi:acetoin utilization deacetylase AcuC-like enzyme